MPNWCENSVKLSGLEEETVSTIARNIMLAENPFPEFLRVLHPVPDLRKKMTDEMIELSARKKGQTVEDYISSWGFNWQRQNWKVKWDIYIPDEQPGNAVLDSGFDWIEVEFLSPWAPPVGTYEHLHEDGVSVRAYYCEFGMNFCGIWFNGQENEYSMQDQEYPRILDETFGITERINVMYEEEEESWNPLTYRR